METIPIIDLQPLVEGQANGIDAIAEAFHHAYSVYGFAYIKNHGVAQTLIDKAFAMNKQFHDLPLDEKLKIRVDESYRGYLPADINTSIISSLGGVTKPNQCASFVVMTEEEGVYEVEELFAGENKWPANCPELHDNLNDYMNALSELAYKLVPAISKVIHAKLDDIIPNLTPASRILRLLHYPPQPESIPDDLYGFAPHTDWGFMTLLAQDEKGGLQVQNTQGDWLDVPYIPGTFVMNTGDILHRMSNASIKSTAHRVINRSGHSRYSMAFFFEPKMSAKITTLDSCIDEQHPNKFAPIIYGDYIKERLTNNYKI